MKAGPMFGGLKRKRTKTNGGLCLVCFFLLEKSIRPIAQMHQEIGKTPFGRHVALRMHMTSIGCWSQLAGVGKTTYLE